jgi:RNA polymerase sigma-70 factor (ECF subfamily)
LKIWRALPAHQGGGAVSSWIYTITRNTCLTELKKRALRPTVSLQAPELAATADSIPALQSPTAALGSEMDVDRMLADLPEKYRRVLILFYMEQRAYDEVACMLGLPLGTVKTLLFRAKKLLLQQGLRDSPGPRNTVRPPQNQSPPRPETSAPPMNIRPEPLLSVL